MQQIQGIGTAWMFPPQRKDDDAASVDRLISRMSMDEVRAYMCPKSYGNPKKCRKCDGFRTCTAGQRAVVLTDEAERLAMFEEDRKQAPELNPVDDREAFRAACESGNAWGYLMFEKGMSESAARTKLEYWVSHYVNIAQEFGGRKRVMSKPKRIRIERIGADVSQDAQDEPQKAPEAVDEETEALEPEEPKKGKKHEFHDAAAARAKSAEVRTARARAFYEECLSQDDPVSWYMEQRGAQRDSATNMLKTACRKYGLDRSLISGRKIAEAPEEVPEEAPEEAPEVIREDDEVSLEDFLNEFDQQEPANPMLDALRAKMDELEAEKARLEERIRCIDEQTAALEKTISLFR